MDTAAAAVWTDSDAPALCLVALGLDRYGSSLNEDDSGTSPINWTPATWEAEIVDDCGVGLHPTSAHRLFAGLSLLSCPDDFYRTAPGFHTIAEGLVSDYFDENTTHPLSIGEIIWAVFQAAMLHPKGTFSPTVSAYVHRICVSDGLPGVPSVLKSFGITPDPSIKPQADLSADPDLSSLTSQSSDDLQSDVNNWLKDRVLDLADRIEKLPLRHTDPRPIAADLRKHFGR
jgi:hypothetical protein